MTGEEGEQVACGCLQAETDPAGRSVRAHFFKAGEERLWRGAYGGATRGRVKAAELTEIDFLVGTIESDSIRT